jgi:hypothetical protein
MRAIGRALRGSPKAVGATAAPAPEEAARAEATPLRRALRRLLDRHPDSRRLLRHLAYVERALARQGTQALVQVPVDVLATALTQLEGIVSNWSDSDLAELRSRMAVAIKQRSDDALIEPGRAQRSDFATASRILVGDVAHSVFEELQRQYEGLLPQDRIQAVLAAGGHPAQAPVSG